MTEDDRNIDPMMQDPSGLSQSIMDKPESRWDYWEKVRAKDPQRYWRRDTQIQIHKEAVTLGDQFHKRTV